MQATSPPSAKKPNLLAREASSYLQSQAYRAVDWHPWTPASLEKAHRLHKPIFLSIGYSSCHFCHQMDSECFDDSSIAKVLNEHFICIKVDREERPDLDEAFLEITSAFTGGQRGWPMTIFLTPDQKAFFAGSFFPLEDEKESLGFRSLLQRLTLIWKQQPHNILQQAKKLATHVNSARPKVSDYPIGDQEITDAVRYYLKNFDLRYGGFTKAPKYPPHGAMSLLLRYYKQTENSQVLHLVCKTLDCMYKGGIYDHLGGGFSRYSIDEKWLVPHFEKMLYDNALLIPIYLDAYLITKNPLYRTVATQTADFVLRELANPNGGFYSSLGAGPEGEEGHFYLWSYEEVKESLSKEEFEAFSAAYKLEAQGHCKGKILINRLHISDLTGFHSALLEQEKKLIKTAIHKLFKKRQNRTKPFRDDKIIVSWTALMTYALARLGCALGEAKYSDAAEKAAFFLLRSMRDEHGLLFRLYRRGKRQQPAFLEDYAFLCLAYLELYECGKSERFLQESFALAEAMMRLFRDPKTGLFHTSSSEHTGSPFVPHQDGTDGAIPNPNATAAFVLAKLSHHLDRPDLCTTSKKALSAIGKSIHLYPHLYPTSLSVVDFHLDCPLNISCVGHDEEERMEDLLQKVHGVYLPNKIVAHFNWGKKVISASPILQDKQLVNDKPTAHVCRGTTCFKPVNTPEKLGELLQTHHSPTRSNIFGFLLTGKASSTGTHQYASFHPKVSFNNTAQDLCLCPIGFGSRKVFEHDSQHRRALELALLSGCNVIDTAANYTDGSSEHCVGLVLREMIEKHQIERSQVFLMSKAGYVQGKALDAALEEKEGEVAFPEMEQIDESCWYCMHPQYLSSQLHQSRARLQVETIDAFFLQDPEQYLLNPKYSLLPLRELRQRFYKQIEKSFTFLEKAAAEGTIQYYGISSNNLALPSNHREKVHLERLVEVAKKVGGENHHFRFVQLPLNLLEAQAITQSDAITQCASSEGISLFARRPLNAVYEEEMVRLSHFEKKELSLDFERHVQWGVALEDEWKTTIAPFIHLPEGLPLPSQLFNWAQALHDLRKQQLNFLDWSHLEEEQITPQLTYLFQLIEQNIQRNEPLYNVWIDWKKRYMLALQPLIQFLRDRSMNQSAFQSLCIDQVTSRLLPPKTQEALLSQKTLRVLTKTPGVTCVINSMHTPKYVQDSLAALELPAPDDVMPIYRALQRKNLFKRSSL